MSAVDGPAFLAAAVTAAIRAKAPRRTVQAVAAAVANVFGRPVTARATPRTHAAESAGAQGRACGEGDESRARDAQGLLDSLRAARSAQRRAKKARRRAARAAASSVPHDAAAGGLHQGFGDSPVSAPLQAHVHPAVPLPPQAHVAAPLSPGAALGLFQTLQQNSDHRDDHNRDRIDDDILALLNDCVSGAAARAAARAAAF